MRRKNTPVFPSRQCSSGHDSDSFGSATDRCPTAAMPQGAIRLRMNPSGCCTDSSGTYCGMRSFRHIETDKRAKKIHTAKRIAKPTSSRQVIAFPPDTPASATVFALAVGHCGHPACGRIGDREAPVTKIRRAHAACVRPLRDSFVFVPAFRIRLGGWPAPKRPIRPFRAAAVCRLVRRTDDTRARREHHGTKLFDFHQRRIDGDGFAFGHEHLFHGTGMIGHDAVLHLHGFENHYVLAVFHRIAR